MNGKRKGANETAVELDLDRKTAYRMLKHGTTPSIRSGKLFIVSRIAHERWLETAGSSLGERAALKAGHHHGNLRA